MEVHKPITPHSPKQNQILTTFLQLQPHPQPPIQPPLPLPSNAKHFSLHPINILTNQINHLPKPRLPPQPKILTQHILIHYLHPLQHKEPP
nr:DUF2533 family protein [Bacillus mycoides]